MDSRLKDLALDEEGEISVGFNGDLLVARDNDVLLQEMRWRMKTVKGDWVLVPQCGADLEYIIGEPNTEETAATVKAQVIEALTHDGFFTGLLEDVIVTYLNKEQILVIVLVDAGYQETLVDEFVLDLKQGVFI